MLQLPLLLLIFVVPLAWGDTAHRYDAENGQDINELCAGCHGEFGEGGSDGEYPRLAGLPADFIARQLHLFRDRQRPNLAMIEYIDERQMPDPDIQDISRYLAGIRLRTKLPPANESDPGFDAYARLLEAKQVMQIPRAEGDQERGGKLYRKECASCHGKLGEGDRQEAVPMLTGQYTDYLWRQVHKYREGVRIHDPEAPEDRLLLEFNDDELQDIFAYLSILDD
ncbi:MAG: c-type cytochrome [Gammaproteobacteria bacterium]|nr:c-type cytochrome [Gammaproteobacteria bacterium]